MNSLVFHWDEAEAYKKDQLAKKKLLKQWTHTAKAFGVYNLMVIGNSDSIPVLGDTEIAITQYDNYEQVRAAHKKAKYVVITEEGKPIESVKFPKKNVIFVVGSNYANPKINDKDITVAIKANIPIWDVVAAGIVMSRAMSCR